MKKLLTLLTFMLFAVVVNAAEDTYVVAGSGLALNRTAGNEIISWNGSAAENKMTTSDYDTYTLVVEGVNLNPLDDHGWKVVKNGSTWIPGGTNNNLTVSGITEYATYTVTYTYVISTDSKTAVAVKTGEAPPPPADTYVVAGTGLALNRTAGNEIISWNGSAEENKMTTSDDDTYTLVVENLTLSTSDDLEWKVVKKGSTWIPGGTNNNLSVSGVTENAIYTVTYTYVISTDSKTAVAVKTGNIPVTYTAKFKNSIGWENVYAYTYPETLGVWPGTEMTNGDVYTISFDSGEAPTKIIFNDGTGGVVGESQTADLVFADGETYDMVSPGYYIVGNMTSWELNKDYKMTKNESADAEEYMKIAMPLQTSNQFKVVKTTDGTNIATWYPSEGDNYGKKGEITEDGTYDIYFRPEEKTGWFGNYIYVAQEISIDITENLWASYSSTKALDFSNSGLTAYIATTSNGSSVHYEPVTYVPANTGIILNGTQGTHVAVTIPSAEAVGTNLLVSTANEEHEVTAGEEGNIYAFGMKGGLVGFVKALAGYTVAQGKSYLDLSKVGAKGIDFIGLPGSETDGIDTIHNAQFIMHNDAYNLAGQKVSKDYKGIVIVNGKKYLNK